MTEAKASWWATRWRIFNDPAGGTQRWWALAEIVCAILTLTTLAAAVAISVASLITAVPRGVPTWALQIALAGAVGYGTNFLAVQMLFKPKLPSRMFPLWRQGLIPAKQAELAEAVGEEVASKLLTPEAIADEISDIVRESLEDPDTIRSLQERVIAFLRDRVPELIRRFLPETKDAVREALDESLPADELETIILDIVDDWFAKEANRALLARMLLGFFKTRTGVLIELLKSAVRRYQKQNPWRGVLVETAEATKGIDWEKLDKALRRLLDKPKGQRWALKVVDDLAGEVRSTAQSLLRSDLVQQLRSHTTELGIDGLEGLVEDNLIPKVAEVIESERFRRYVVDELLPEAKPRIVQWLRRDQLGGVVARFDVRGRVTKAAAEMDVDELEAMANRVGAYHLGAIQVLGYLLGLCAGVLMAVATRS